MEREAGEGNALVYTVLFVGEHTRVEGKKNMRDMRQQVIPLGFGRVYIYRLE